MVGVVHVDDRWVVPYSPHLSRGYNAHINAETCFNVLAVKCVYKDQNLT